jgi:hypothetical protein
MEEKRQKIGIFKRFWRPIVALGILIVLVLLLIGIFKFGSLLALFWFVPWIAGKISQAMGIGMWPAYILAVIAALIAVYVLALTYRKATRRYGIILALATFVAFSLVMWYTEKDYMFGPDGTPTRCVADTPYGYQYVPCSWEFHRVYKTKVIPVTREIANSMVIQEKGLPRITKLAISKDVRFFSPNGDPLVWYYEDPDGKIYISFRPEKHPHLNADLSPITPEIVKKVLDGERVAVINEIEHPRTAEGSELEKLRDFLLDLNKGR